MKPISPIGLPIGFSVALWTIVGLIRYGLERLEMLFGLRKDNGPQYTKKDIAVIIPAHNEQLVIRRCIRALKKSLPARQIHVVSDGSTDNTYKYAKSEGVNVIATNPGIGKAKALLLLIDKYNLYKNYKLIFIVDSDTQIDINFIPRALKLFRSDKELGVVFGSAQIRWPDHIIPRVPYFFIAYRERLNRILQYFLAYGQTWKYTNVPYVIPGFATIYKSKVLSKLKMDVPGILVEDFNLAFQFHRKKLGTIGYDPGMIGWDQHPNNLVDYWKQVRRWNIGFFQTVRENGVWPSMFWLALGLFSIEVLINCIFVLFLPFIIFLLLLPYTGIEHPLVASLIEFQRTAPILNRYNLFDIYITVFAIDIVLTVIIGWLHKKPQFVLYGLFFFFMHYVTSLIFLSSLVPGFLSRSHGKWVSPKRHEIGLTGEAVKI